MCVLESFVMTKAVLNPSYLIMLRHFSLLQLTGGTLRLKGKSLGSSVRKPVWTCSF